jgi:hypothetical protein
MVSLRQCRDLASPARNGGASIRRTAVDRPAAVASQDGGTGRGGNFSITARASPLSCQGRATALADTAAVADLAAFAAAWRARVAAPAR